MKTMILGLVSALLLAALVSSPSYAQTTITCDSDHTLVAGDWLSKLAQKYFGSAGTFQALATQTNLKSETDFSYATIVNPDSIQVGWKLCVPNAETANALNGVNAPAGLDKNALENATYTSMVANEPVTLVNGSYKKQDDPGIPLTTDVSLTDQIAYGNINGVPSAAVVTGETGGGSGFFYLLHIMQVQDGKATEVANTLLGDRSPIIALTVNNNLASVDMITQGPDEPFCCATLRVINNFKLDGNQLVLDSQKELGNLGPDGETPGAPLYVSGLVTYLERIAMPDGAVVKVRVADVSLADAPAVVIGEQTITEPGNVPVTYSVVYDGSQVKPQNTYAVSARIEVNGELMWINTTRIPVITNGAPTQDVEILVERVSGTTGSTAPTANADLEKLQAGRWYWQGSTYTDGTTAIPDDPSKYTVTFGSEGSLSARVDCNQASGPYEVQSNTLSVGPLISTLALCAEGSLSNEYLRDLQALGEFKFEGDNLIVTFKENLGTATFSPEASTSGMAPEPSAQSLTGVVWEWQGSKYNYGTTPNPTPDNPSNYTVQFGDDGQLVAQADCNQAGGPYEVQGTDLSIGPLNSTLALCAPGSLSSEFLFDLESAAAYFFEGDNLVIAVRAGRGLVTFAPAKQATTTPTSEPSAPTPETTESLTGAVWKWQGTTTPVEEITIADPNNYTVEFMPDGKLQINADCNTGAGTYAADNGTLTMGPIALTKVFCGEQSNDTLFVSQLQNAAIYFFADGNLMLDQTADSGTMKFSK